MKVNYKENTKNVIANLLRMTDNELINLTAEYNMICETLERTRRNDGPAYWGYAECYNAALAECKKRNINTRGLE